MGQYPWGKTVEPPCGCSLALPFLPSCEHQYQTHVELKDQNFLFNPSSLETPSPGRTISSAQAFLSHILHPTTPDPVLCSLCFTPCQTCCCLPYLTFMIPPADNQGSGPSPVSLILSSLRLQPAFPTPPGHSAAYHIIETLGHTLPQTSPCLPFQTSSWNPTPVRVPF